MPMRFSESDWKVADDRGTPCYEFAMSEAEFRTLRDAIERLLQEKGRAIKEDLNWCMRGGIPLGGGFLGFGSVDTDIHVIREHDWRTGIEVRFFAEPADMRRANYDRTNLQVDKNGWVRLRASLGAEQVLPDERFMALFDELVDRALAG